MVGYIIINDDFVEIEWLRLACSVIIWDLAVFKQEVLTKETIERERLIVIGLV